MDLKNTIYSSDSSSRSKRHLKKEKENNYGNNATTHYPTHDMR